MKKKGVDTDLLFKIELKSFMKDDVGLDNVREMWYAKTWIPLHRGVRQIRMDKDIVDFCSLVGKDGVLEVYVICGSEVSPRTLLDEEKVSKAPKPTPKPIAKPKNNGPSHNPKLAAEAPICTPLSTSQSLAIIEFPSSSRALPPTRHSFHPPSSSKPVPLLLTGATYEYDDSEVEGDEVSDVNVSKTSNDDDVVYEKNIFGDSNEEDDVMFDKKVAEDNIPADLNR